MQIKSICELRGRRLYRWTRQCRQLGLSLDCLFEFHHELKLAVELLNHFLLHAYVSCQLRELRVTHLDEVVGFTTVSGRQPIVNGVAFCKPCGTVFTIALSALDFLSPGVSSTIRAVLVARFEVPDFAQRLQHLSLFFVERLSRAIIIISQLFRRGTRL